MSAQLSPNGRAFTLPGGVAVGQSQDGCLLIAASAPRLESAIPQQDTFQRLGLAREGPGGFAFSGEFLEEFARRCYFLLTAAEMGEIERASGPAPAGESRGNLDASRAPIEGRAGGGRALVRSMQLDVQAASVQNLGFWTRGRAAVTLRKHARAVGPGLVQFDSPWGRPDIDRATENLAREDGLLGGRTRRSRLSPG